LVFFWGFEALLSQRPITVNELNLQYFANLIGKSALLPDVLMLQAKEPYS
jgi:hypothetical protein